MRNCPTGYCGDPCLCKGSLDHLSDEDARTMIRLATERLHALGAKAVSEKHGEPMVAYPAVEVKLVTLRYHGQLVKCDHLLHRAILRKENQGIYTTSGVRTVMLNAEGDPIFVPGEDHRFKTKIRFEVLDWNGDISASIECSGGHIQEAFVKLVNTTVYLPSDVE